MEELLQRIRFVTEEDREQLPVFSYSKFDVFKKCPMQYYIKYEEGKRPVNESTIALELGTLCHYVLEQKGIMLTEKQEVDYDALFNILDNGYKEEDNAILGVSDLKKKYFEEWFVPDNASGANYEEKLKLYKKILYTEMEGTDWCPKYFEFPFEFVYDDKIIITGFIDRIDCKEVEDEGIKHTLYKCLDYKTSKKIYSKTDIATSMQFAIYSMAILLYFKTLPIECEYRFIFLNDSQFALTKGWEDRIIKNLNKLLEGVETCKTTGVYKPKPTPLCHWCSYCKTNPNAHEFNNECQYFSLWTPYNKTFDTNKPFTEKGQKTEVEKRKIIF